MESVSKKLLRVLYQKGRKKEENQGEMPKPQEKWTCPHCQTLNEGGIFCRSCGQPKTEKYDLSQGERKKRYWIYPLVVLEVMGILFFGVQGYGKRQLAEENATRMENHELNFKKEADDAPATKKEKTADEEEKEKQEKQQEAVEKQKKQEQEKDDAYTYGRAHLDNAIQAFDDYQDALDKGDTRRAYSYFTENMREQMGDYEEYARGYQTTVNNQITDGEAQVMENGDVVISYTLESEDYQQRQIVRQRFQGEATLVRVGNQWKISAMQARKVN